MNCLIILLLLFCCGNSNGDCGNCSCGCRENKEDKDCRRKDNDDCGEDYRDQRYSGDDRRESRYSDERRRSDSDYCDSDQRMRTAPWQDYSNYNRNDSYGRSETCGCEEK